MHKLNNIIKYLFMYIVLAVVLVLLFYPAHADAAGATAGERAANAAACTVLAAMSADEDAADKWCKELAPYRMDHSQVIAFSMGYTAAVLRTTSAHTGTPMIAIAKRHYELKRLNEET